MFDLGFLSKSQMLFVWSFAWRYFIFMVSLWCAIGSCYDPWAMNLRRCYVWTQPLMQIEWRNWDLSGEEVGLSKTEALINIHQPHKLLYFYYSLSIHLTMTCFVLLFRNSGVLGLPQPWTDRFFQRPRNHSEKPGRTRSLFVGL